MAAWCIDAALSSYSVFINKETKQEEQGVDHLSLTPSRAVLGSEQKD
jgi:hypothetical protein